MPDPMTDDLVDELQELAVTPWLNSQARVACRSAADEIERLRAVIAEALAALDPPRPLDPSEHADYAEGLEDGAAIKSERLRAILSRVPQGAAEPSEGFVFGGISIILDETVPIGMVRVNGELVPMIGSEPSPDPQHADSGNAWGDDRAAEPWTDPEPWVGTHGRRHARDDHFNGVSLRLHDPRTREQYDAEEGTK